MANTETVPAATWLNIASFISPQLPNAGDRQQVQQMARLADMWVNFANAYPALAKQNPPQCWPPPTAEAEMPALY